MNVFENNIMHVGMEVRSKIVFQRRSKSQMVESGIYTGSVKEW